MTTTLADRALVSAAIVLGAMAVTVIVWAAIWLEEPVPGFGLLVIPLLGGSGLFAWRRFGIRHGVAVWLGGAIGLGVIIGFALYVASVFSGGD